MLPEQSLEPAENTSAEERKLSVFSYTLMGLIKLHPAVHGYELNSFFEKSLGHHLEASLSNIYPTLNKLSEGGYVKFDEIAVPNRLPIKAYQITDVGDVKFQKWLGEPIPWRLSMRPFLIKMYFAGFMEKQVILDHIDREIENREFRLKAALDRGLSVEMDFMDKGHIDNGRADYRGMAYSIIGNDLFAMVVQTEEVRIRFLKEMRKHVEENLQPSSMNLMPQAG